MMRTAVMLEEQIKLHGFAGISPKKSLAEAGRQREAMVAAEQGMVIRCLGDDFAGFVDDDFHAPPPMQRPVSAAVMLRNYLTSCRLRRSKMVHGSDGPPASQTPCRPGPFELTCLCGEMQTPHQTGSVQALRNTRLIEEIAHGRSKTSNFAKCSLWEKRR
jgi:hypothetical protein